MESQHDSQPVSEELHSSSASRVRNSSPFILDCREHEDPFRLPEDVPCPESVKANPRAIGKRVGGDKHSVVGSAETGHLMSPVLESPVPILSLSRSMSSLADHTASPTLGGASVLSSPEQGSSRTRLERRKSETADQSPERAVDDPLDLDKSTGTKKYVRPKCFVNGVRVKVRSEEERRVVKDDVMGTLSRNPTHKRAVRVPTISYSRRGSALACSGRESTPTCSERESRSSRGSKNRWSPKLVSRQEPHVVPTVHVHVDSDDSTKKGSEKGPNSDEETWTISAKFSSQLECLIRAPAAVMAALCEGAGSSAILSIRAANIVTKRDHEMIPLWPCKENEVRFNRSLDDWVTVPVTIDDFVSIDSETEETFIDSSVVSKIESGEWHDMVQAKFSVYQE